MFEVFRLITKLYYQDEENGTSTENLPGMPKAFQLAEEMGTLLGGGEVLQ